MAAQRRLTGDSINDFMYIDSLHTLSEDFLVRNDKLGMAFGMESRFPFMCSVFKDFVRGIPGKLKATPSGPNLKFDLHNKRLFRAAYAGRLPAFITNKRKQAGEHLQTLGLLEQGTGQLRTNLL